MTVAELLDAFLAWTARHRAPATAEFYAGRLKLFRAEYSGRPAGSLTSLELDAFLERVGQGQSDTTRRHNAVALTALQNFAVRERLLERPWFLKLEKPRAARREWVPTPADIGKLLAGASEPFSRFVQGLAQSGARPGELVRLTVADVDWAKGVCRLAEHKTARKTGKPRLIAIGAAFRATLLAALLPRSSGTVFLSPRGKAWTVDGFETAWRRLRKKAGLPPQFVPYHLRHWHATELLRAGTPIKTVADLLGHASVTTTEIYLHRDVSELGHEQDRLPDVAGTLRVPSADGRMSANQPDKTGLDEEKPAA